MHHDARWVHASMKCTKSMWRCLYVGAPAHTKPRPGWGSSSPSLLPLRNTLADVWAEALAWGSISSLDQPGGGGGGGMGVAPLGQPMGIKTAHSLLPPRNQQAHGGEPLGQLLMIKTYC